eukprot:192522-Pyramimonas_sp.AAC.1
MALRLTLCEDRTRPPALYLEDVAKEGRPNVTRGVGFDRTPTGTTDAIFMIELGLSVLWAKYSAASVE